MFRGSHSAHLVCRYQPTAQCYWCRAATDRTRARCFPAGDDSPWTPTLGMGLRFQCRLCLPCHGLLRSLCSSVGAELTINHPPIQRSSSWRRLCCIERYGSQLTNTRRFVLSSSAFSTSMKITESVAHLEASRRDTVIRASRVQLLIRRVSWL